VRTKARKKKFEQVTIHYSAILSPKNFAATFKDIYFCARCCDISKNKVSHDCIVPLNRNSPLKSLLGEKPRSAADRLINELSYREIMEEIECKCCHRWIIYLTKDTKRLLQKGGGRIEYSHASTSKFSKRAKLKKTEEPLNSVKKKTCVMVSLKAIKKRVLYGNEIPLIELYDDMPLNQKNVSWYHQQNTFCFGQRGGVFSCDKCKVRCRSRLCMSLHQKKSSCVNKWTCSKCHLHYPISFVKNATYWKLCHKHFDTKCGICQNWITDVDKQEHYCPMKMYTAPEDYRKFGVFDFETSASMETGHHEAVFLSCVFETEKVGEFFNLNFASPCLNVEEAELLDKQHSPLNINYFPDGEEIWIPKMPNLLTEKQFLGPFSNIKTANTHIAEVNDDRTEKEQRYNSAFTYDPKNEWDSAYLWSKYDLKIDLIKLPDNAITQFLRFILRPRFAHYTFLSHNGGKFDMKLLWFTLIKLNKLPIKPLLKNRNFISIWIGGPLDILFLDSLKFFGTGLDNVCKRFGLQKNLFSLQGFGTEKV